MVACEPHASGLGRLLGSVTLVAMLAFAGLGCGDGSSTGSNSVRVDASSGPTKSSHAVRLATHVHDGDADNDSLGMGRLDSDNDAIPTFGRTASTAERGAITSLFRRFYTAAAAGRGAAACSMLYWLVAEELVEEHSRGRGPAARRGVTCAQIAKKIFREHHRELVSDVTELRVTIIQLRRNRGWAVLDFAPARELLGTVQREGAGWKLGSLLKFDSL